MYFTDTPQQNRFLSLFSASSLTFASFTGLVVLMAPPIVEMMM